MSMYDNLINNFPGTPRPQQSQALQAMAPWLDSINPNGLPEAKFFGCDAPTGVGKSFIAIAVARTFHQLSHQQVWIVTQNKLLQDQYMNDFPKDLYCLKGISNYECYEDVGKSCDESRCGRVRKENAKFPEACPRNCEYDEAMREARMSPILMLNAAKALNLIKISKFMPPDKQWKPGLILYDEGHSIEPQLDNEASLAIKAEEMEKLQLNFNEFFDKPRQGPIPGIDARLRKLLVRVYQIYETEQSAPDSYRDLKRLKKSESMLNKIAEVLSNIDELKIDYVNGSDEFIDLRPLKIYPVFRNYIKVPTIFLSATLLSKVGFCTTIGIKPDDIGWINVDSPFPVQNRKIHNLFAMGAQGINYYNQEEQTPNVLERVKDALARHPDERGIIHCHTYKWAMKIYEINREVGGRLLYPRTAAEQKEILERHANSRNTVLLSPSMTEGVDLKGDLARFGMIVKVPYLPTQDPVIKARMEADPTWYGYKSIMTFIQASGRIVRSVEDYGEMYLLDPGFVKFITRYKTLFPPWFLEAYQKGKYIGRC